MKIEAFKDPRFGRYYDINGWPLPSVTTILDATRPAGDVEALRQWAERVGEEQAELIRKQSAERGTRTHELIERQLAGEQVEDAEAEAMGILPWWLSVRPVLSQLGTVHLMEHTVHHSRYLYAGSLDLLVGVETVDRWEGTAGEKPVLLDWKTSGKAKRREWLGDYPVQLAAYWQATQESHPEPIEEAWIVLAHPNGAAQVHRFCLGDLKRCWIDWLLRLEKFWLLHPEHPLAHKGLQAIKG